MASTNGRKNGRVNGKASPDRMMSREEVLELVDRQARKLLGMSAQEFLKASSEGKLPHTGAVTHLQMLAGF